VEVPQLLWKLWTPQIERMKWIGRRIWADHSPGIWQHLTSHAINLLADFPIFEQLEMLWDFWTPSIDMIRCGKRSSDQRNSQSAVNFDFEENPNQIPDNMHNI
jgi:hypothetical protein